MHVMIASEGAKSGIWEEDNVAFKASVMCLSFTLKKRNDRLKVLSRGRKSPVLLNTRRVYIKAKL